MLWGLKEPAASRRYNIKTYIDCDNDFGMHAVLQETNRYDTIKSELSAVVLSKGRGGNSRRGDGISRRGLGKGYFRKSLSGKSRGKSRAPFPLLRFFGDQGLLSRDCVI